jgi:acyl-CoA thioester hydrolase
MTTAEQPIRRTRLRVRYAETDRMGVVYYANYLVWFEVGRAEWLRQAGWSYREMEREGIALPVIEAHCEYRAPARYDDEIEVAARGTLLTAARIRFDYEVARVGDDAIAAVGHTARC